MRTLQVALCIPLLTKPQVSFLWPCLTYWPNAIHLFDDLQKAWFCLYVIVLYSSISFNNCISQSLHEHSNAMSAMLADAVLQPLQAHGLHLSDLAPKSPPVPNDPECDAVQQLARGLLLSAASCQDAANVPEPSR